MKHSSLSAIAIITMMSSEWEKHQANATACSLFADNTKYYTIVNTTHLLFINLYGPGKETYTCYSYDLTVLDCTVYQWTWRGKDLCACSSYKFT